jgi:hypothetical protein
MKLRMQQMGPTVPRGRYHWGTGRKAAATREEANRESREGGREEDEEEGEEMRPGGETTITSIRPWGRCSGFWVAGQRWLVEGHLAA